MEKLIFQETKYGSHGEGTWAVWLSDPMAEPFSVPHTLRQSWRDTTGFGLKGVSGEGVILNKVLVFWGNDLEDFKYAESHISCQMK